MGKILWFTGMSGAGKSSIAEEVVAALEDRDLKVKLFDGDSIRREIHTKLGFSRDDILKNNMQVVDLINGCRDEFDFVLVAMISPLTESRIWARENLEPGYTEIHVDASREILIKRDVKGLYKRALNGEINNLIGINDGVPYEIPSDPEIHISTDKVSIQDAVEIILKKIF